MASLINLPTVFTDYLKPERMSVDTPGAGLEGGRNGLGESITIGLSGGPMVAVTYGDCFVQAPEEHEYLNRIAARCNGSFRFINVEIMSDWAGPFPLNGGGIPQPFVTGIPHSDGSFFTDGSGYSQATVFGTFPNGAALNAGEIVVNVFGASRNLRHSDWMSTYHDVKGWRAWRYWDVSDPVDVTEIIDGVSRTGKRYTLAIDVPLRQAVPAGQRIEFARPRCVMKFPTGFTLPWEASGFWLSRPTLEFVEAF